MLVAAFEPSSFHCVPYRLVDSAADGGGGDDGSAFHGTGRDEAWREFEGQQQQQQQQQQETAGDEGARAKRWRKNAPLLGGDTVSVALEGCATPGTFPMTKTTITTARVAAAATTTTVDEGAGTCWVERRRVATRRRWW